MKKSLILLGVAATLAIVAGCAQKKEPAKAQAATAVAPVAQKVPFVAPADSAISRDRLTKWLACNPLLDSLSIMYQDSFKVDDAGIKLRRQSDFTKAQDRICVRAGLAGGYDEYLWVRKVMGVSRNKTLLDSLGVGVY